MRKIGTAALVAGVVLAFAPLAHAAPDPTGFLCGFSSTFDPQVEGSQTGEIDGGPLALVDSVPESGTVYAGSLTCTIQTGTNDTYAEADAASKTGPTSTGVVALPPTPITYEAGLNEPVYICTTVNITGGSTLYYDYATSSWSDNPLTATCDLAIAVEGSPVDPQLCGIFGALPEPLRTLLRNTWGTCPR